MNLLIIDDSITVLKGGNVDKTYGYVNHKYHFRFCMILLRWFSFLIVNSVFIPWENKRTGSVNKEADADKLMQDTGVECSRVKRGTYPILPLLKTAKKVPVSANYDLLDSRFFSPNILYIVKSIGYDLIGIVKRTLKIFFL